MGTGSTSSRHWFETIVENASVNYSSDLPIRWCDYTCPREESMPYQLLQSLCSGFDSGASWQSTQPTYTHTTAASTTLYRQPWSMHLGPYAWHSRKNLSETKSELRRTSEFSWYARRHLSASQSPTSGLTLVPSQPGVSGLVPALSI